MKIILLSSLLSICMLQVNSQFAFIGIAMTSPSNFSYSKMNNKGPCLCLQAQPGDGKMSSIVFKNQKYCRAELPADFEFNARFAVVSASVYFSGANFKNVEKGFITSSSLKPVEYFMARCIPGTIVVFDDVKVVGPDKKIRTIQGLSLLLY